MNIFIISNYFFPNNRIASFRINAFAKYFHEVGYEVTVVTEGCCDYTTFWEGCEIHYLKDPVICNLGGSGFPGVLFGLWNTV